MLEKVENTHVEFKSNSKSTFLKTVSAFANYFNGDIYFGIEDDGEVSGIEDINNEKLAIENAINDGIKPRPKFTLKVIELDKKEVINLKVFKGSKPPYMFKNKSYQRQDTSTIPVDEVAFQQLYLEGSNLSFDELETECTELNFSILENNLKNVIGIVKITDDLLRTMGLLKGEIYTNAGKLFSDSNNYKFGLDMVRFGASDNIFLERREVKGTSLLKQYNEAMDMFDKWYSPYEEVVGFYREQRIQIPREAFRETIANALVHRDYVLKSNIRIAMRENSIEIISPGGLPTGISKDAYIKGLYSQLRNETIAETFRRLQIVEKFGTGVKRIREAYQEFKESPEFDVIDGLAIQVVLPKINYNKNGTDYDLNILTYINQNVEANRAEIQEAVGGSDAKLKRSLQRLANENKITKVGSGRSTKYQSIK